MRDSQIREELETLKYVLDTLNNTWAVDKIESILKLLDDE